MPCTLQPPQSMLRGWSLLFCAGVVLGPMLVGLSVGRSLLHGSDTRTARAEKYGEEYDEQRVSQLNQSTGRSFPSASTS